MREGLNYVNPGSELRGANGLEVFGTRAGGLYVPIGPGDLKKPRGTPPLEPGPRIYSIGSVIQLPGDVGPVHLPGDWIFTVPPGWVEADDPVIRGGTVIAPPAFKGKLTQRKESLGIKASEIPTGHGGVFSMVRGPNGAITAIYNDGAIEIFDLRLGRKSISP